MAQHQKQDQCENVDSSDQDRDCFNLHAKYAKFFTDAADYLRIVKKSYPSLTRNDLIRLNAERLVALEVLKENIDAMAVFWAKLFLENYKTTLINGHLWMPIFIVVKYFSKNQNRNQNDFTAMDLIQFGNEGLLNAYRKYNPEKFKNILFSTFAFWEVYDKISKFLNRQKSYNSHFSLLNSRENAFLQNCFDTEFQENLQFERLKNLDYMQKSDNLEFKDQTEITFNQECVRKALAQLSPHDAKFLRILYGIGTPIVANAEDISKMLDIHVKSVYRKDLYLKDKLKKILSDQFS